MLDEVFTIYHETGFLHHGYVVVGEREAIVQNLKTRLGTAAIYDSSGLFGIAQSRLLKERQSRKLELGGRRFFVLAAQTITLEAQQALLKTFEEPNPGNHFFIIVSSETLVLPTLRSRCEIIYYPSRHPSAAVEKKPRVFLSAPPEERLEIVAELLSTADAGDSDAIPAFLNGLELSIVPDFKAGTEIKRARGYLRQQGNAPRLILEHLALVLPRN